LIIEKNGKEVSLVIHTISVFYERVKQNPENVTTLLGQLLFFVRFVVVLSDGV